MLSWRTAAGTAMAFAILMLIVVHTLPIQGITVDQTTIGLLIMMTAALLLPDLTRVVGPGGWEADFQRNISEAERGLAQSPPPLVPTPTATPDPGTKAPDGPDTPDQSSNLMAFSKPRWPMDAGLQLAHLRVSLETYLRRMDAGNDGPLPLVIDRLADKRRINHSLHRSIEAFLRAADAYLGSRRSMVPVSVTRALAIGEELLRRLTDGSGGV